MINKKNITCMLLFFSLAMVSCNKWKDHTEVLQQELNLSLMQAISANPDLSKFKEYIVLAGLDTLLQSSKTFTVWAPTNAALQAIDPAVPADKVKLRAFILNHISNQLYFTKDAQLTLRIPMIGGKYNNFSATKFEETTLVTADNYFKNGVLHTISGIVPPLQSIWEFINATSTQYAQNAYVLSLNFNGFDPSLATIDSISVLTGLPVYRPGTGIVPRNILNERVLDTRREEKEFTYFVMQDANFIVESDSLKPYFVSATTAATDSLTRWNVVKDLVYETPYATAAAIPLSLVSKSGVTVPVNKLFIVDVKRMSNGVVYILSKLDVPTANKFLPVILEGESPRGFLQNDKTGNTNYRIRLNPVTNTNFGDIMISGHAVTTFYAYYRQNESPSIKYQVWAKASNDFQAGAFSQTINAFHTTLGTVQGTLTHAVPLFTAVGAYDEKNLGIITITRFGTIDWRLTSITTGPLLLDYLRLVPIP